VGTANPAGGNVAVEFPAGLTYVPGQQQRWVIRVTDPAARVFGFQITVRQESNIKNQAGRLDPTDNATFVLCSSGDFVRVGDRTGATCPVNQPLESLQHSRTLAAPANSWTINWTPPTTAVGNIRVFVAGNGANGNGQNSGDRIYNANYTLTASTGGGGPRPAISQGGVISAASFGGSTTIAPGTWIEIYGNNLATATRDWGGAFNGSNAPTSLDNVRVSIANQPAFISFISPGQINAQVPAGVGDGPTTLTVTNANGTSDNFSVTIRSRNPALLSPPAFRVNNVQYLAALFPDNTTFVGRANLIAGAAFRPARAGETIITYGIGFGSVSPNINPGVIVGQANTLPNLRVLFGQTQATVSYGGLAPNFVGLYQFNLVVPNGLPAGDIPISFAVDGVNAQSNLFTTVQ
jgi:uncharacterized protein (TIGR03437 family)